MANLELNQTTQSNLGGTVRDYSPSADSLDKPEDINENTWDNTNYDEWNRYYKTDGIYKTALNSFSSWVTGKGWSSDSRTTAILNNITGWGEDTFQSIMWNMHVVKKLQGDSYAEIMRNKDGTIVNIKPLGTLRHVTNKKGRIIRYETLDKPNKKFRPTQILHFCNNRVADEIHGTGITESVAWSLDARKEAMHDWRRISHRSTIRVMYIDSANTTKLNQVKSQYAEAIRDGELMIIPAKKGDAEFEELTLPPVEAFLAWIRHLEDVIYREIGVPRVILGGGSSGEGDGKVSYLTFEQIYVREIEEIKADLWNQLAIKVEFSEPVSLKDKIQVDERKNSSQVGFQPNDTQAGVGE